MTASSPLPPQASPSPQGREPLSFTVRLAIFYGALFLIYGVHLPYLPVWLDWRGLTPTEISIITATPFFLRVFITPTVALYADHHGAHRALAIGLAVSALALALVLGFMSSFWTIFLIAVPFSIFVSTIMPLTETIAVTGVRRAGLDYGRMRLWGSLTFVGVNFTGGWLIDQAGAQAAVWLVLFGAIVTAATANLLPIERTEEAAVTSASSRAPSIETALKLMREPVFLFFLLAAGASQGAHGMFYSFGALHWREQGISTTWIGVLWAIAVGGEVLLFAYSGAVVKRFGPVNLLMAAGAASIVRWILMCFDPPSWSLPFIQVSHALTYGASHLGAMHFISRAIPPKAAGTAQASYSTVAAGLMMGGSTLLAGYLYTHAGAYGYLAMAALGAVGLGAALMVRARWSGGFLLPER